MTANELDDLPQPGAVVAGKYLVVRVIGRGGMGAVLEAHHKRLGQSVALKLLLPSIRPMAEVTARFEREARAVARLQGPHVARILDVDALPDGSPFMVMELLRGRELGDELKERRKFPMREAVGYILQACAAMAEAHRMGIVHRDLKPGNLFLNNHDGYRMVKVVDFGISKLAGDVQASMTTTASAFGTPLYMSPEQVRSVKNVDARTDIWSLGVVLYELLAGEPPFLHESATAILASIVMDEPTPLGKRCPELPRPLTEAVMKALEKEPDARFEDVRDFAAALAPYGPPREDPSQTAVALELLGVEAVSGDAARRRRIGVAAALGALAVGLTAAAIFFVASSKEPASIDPERTDVSAQPVTIPSSMPTSTGPTVEPAVVPEPSAAPTPIAPVPSSAPVLPRPKPTTEPTKGPEPKTVPTPTAPPASTDDPKYL